MKILNLVNKDNSDIDYKISKFPDGQQNIVINGVNWLEDDDEPIPVTIDKFNTLSNCPFSKQKIQIKSRLNNWLDLELIVASVASLRELGVEEIHLYTPYIIGARSDRKFEDGGNNYLKDVICPIINSLNFKTVTCIDHHSDVLEACIKGFKKESNEKLVRFATNNYQYQNKKTSGNMAEDFILVSPDAGASKKIYKLAEQIGYKGDIITCSKDRDVDGNLTKCVVPLEKVSYKGVLPNKDFIIIDDICDGGVTFLNIAEVIRNTYENSDINPKIYLVVSHGIFSKGFQDLNQLFNGIYSTNSYKDFGDFAGNDMQKTNLKQLNVY